MNNVKILYWCPFISKVATIKAVVNSAEGLIKYSKNTIKPEIMNVFGEWSDYQYNNFLIHYSIHILINNCYIQA